MTVVHVVARATSSDNQDTENVFQHLYFVVAVAIVLACVVLRIIVLRRRNQALSDFFRIGSPSQYSYGSYPPHDSGYGSMYHGIQLAPVPAVYHPNRRVRAADIDARGRRLGLGEEDWEGKDTLPAYDSLDRPPKYVEAGWSRAGPPPPTQQPTMNPSIEGEQSGMTHPNTPSGVIGDNAGQSPHNTHVTARVVHENEAPLPPPTHDDSSAS